MTAAGDRIACSAAAASSRAPAWCGVTMRMARSDSVPIRSRTSPVASPMAVAVTGCRETAAAKPFIARQSPGSASHRRQHGEGHDRPRTLVEATVGLDGRVRLVGELAANESVAELAGLDG